MAMGAIDIAIAGGVEHMGNHPMGELMDPNPRYLAERIVEQDALAMGATAEIGFMEIGMAVAFAGLFMRIILVNLTKAPLSPVNHPFLDESIHHEI